LASCGSNDRLAWELRCVERIQRGNREAFDEIYAAFAPALYAQVLLRGWAALSRRRTRWRRRSGPRWRSWATSARRAAASSLAGEDRREQGDGPSPGAHAHGEGAGELRLAGRPLREVDLAAGLEADRRLDQHRLRATVDEVLARLSARYRRAIELRMLEDLPRVECARQMETTIGNFDVLLLRALRAFRGEWIAQHGESWEEP